MRDLVAINNTKTKRADADIGIDADSDCRTPSRTMNMPDFYSSSSPQQREGASPSSPSPSNQTLPAPPPRMRSNQKKKSLVDDETSSSSEHDDDDDDDSKEKEEEKEEQTEENVAAFCLSPSNSMMRYHATSERLDTHSERADLVGVTKFNFDNPRHKKDVEMINLQKRASALLTIHEVIDADAAHSDQNMIMADDEEEDDEESFDKIMFDVMGHDVANAVLDVYEE